MLDLTALPDRDVIDLRQYDNRALCALGAQLRALSARTSRYSPDYRKAVDLSCLVTEEIQDRRRAGGAA